MRACSCRRRSPVPAAVTTQQQQYCICRRCQTRNKRFHLSLKQSATHVARTRVGHAAQSQLGRRNTPQRAVVPHEWRRAECFTHARTHARESTRTRRVASHNATHPHTNTAGRALASGAPSAHEPARGRPTRRTCHTHAQTNITAITTTTTTTTTTSANSAAAHGFGNVRPRAAPTRQAHPRTHERAAAPDKGSVECITHAHTRRTAGRGAAPTRQAHPRTHQRAAAPHDGRVIRALHKPGGHAPHAPAHGGTRGGGGGGGARGQ